MDIYEEIDVYTRWHKDDEAKRKFYEEHNYTKEEIEKTQKLKNRLEEFFKVVKPNYHLNWYYKKISNSIRYFDNLGYITIVDNNTFESTVSIDSYGKTEEDAFLNAAIDIDMEMNQSIYTRNNIEFEKDYYKRFLDEEYDDDYLAQDHGMFYIIELTLKDFRDYYGDDLPIKLINNLEDFVNEDMNTDFSYDFEKDCLIERSSKRVELK